MHFHIIIAISFLSLVLFLFFEIFTKIKSVILRIILVFLLLCIAIFFYSIEAITFALLIIMGLIYLLSTEYLKDKRLLNIINIILLSAFIALLSLIYETTGPFGFRGSEVPTFGFPYQFKIDTSIISSNTYSFEFLEFFNNLAFYAIIISILYIGYKKLKNK